MPNKESGCVASIGERMTCWSSHERELHLLPRHLIALHKLGCVCVGLAGWFRKLGIRGTRSIENVARNWRTLVANDHNSRNSVMGDAGSMLM